MGNEKTTILIENGIEIEAVETHFMNIAESMFQTKYNNQQIIKKYEHFKISFHIMHKH